MAKRLGFQPRSLIRSRPDPKQKWKLPVKYWIHELHFKRFGQVIGEKPLDVTPADPLPPLTEEEMRQLEEQFYWEDYYDRNSDPPPKKTRKGQPSRTLPATTDSPAPAAESTTAAWPELPECGITHDDVPF
jgi:hypothetical protein